MKDRRSPGTGPRVRLSFRERRMKLYETPQAIGMWA
jgi:hypothetical protein